MAEPREAERPNPTTNTTWHGRRTSELLSKQNSGAFPAIVRAAPQRAPAYPESATAFGSPTAGNVAGAVLSDMTPFFVAGLAFAGT